MSPGFLSNHEPRGLHFSIRRVLYLDSMLKVKQGLKMRLNQCIMNAPPQVRGKDERAEQIGVQ